MRIAAHAHRQGWRFPLFSEDAVTQFAVEEALTARWAAAQEQPAEAAVDPADDPAAHARAIQAKLAAAGV